MAYDYTDPMQGLTALNLEDDDTGATMVPPAPGGGVGPLSMAQAAPQGDQDQLLARLRDQVAGKFLAPPSQDRGPLVEAAALAGAGAKLAAPAHNFWEALNGAIGTYANVKLQDQNLDDVERIKYGQILANLYRTKAAATVAANQRWEFRTTTDGVWAIDRTNPGNRQLVATNDQVLKTYRDLFPGYAEQAKTLAFYGPNAGNERAAWAHQMALKATQAAIAAAGRGQPGPMPGLTPGAAPGPVQGAPAGPQGTPQRQQWQDSYGTPKEILDKVEQVESNGNQFAMSKKGAMGPYQFTVPLIQDLYKEGYVFNPFVPEEARRAADFHLSRLYQRYGDWGKALAAYNAGPGAVDSGKPLPQETRDYVPKVLGTTPPTQVAGPVPIKDTGADKGREAGMEKKATGEVEAVKEAVIAPATGAAAVLSSVRDLRALNVKTDPLAKVTFLAQQVAQVLGISPALLGNIDALKTGEAVLSNMTNAILTTFVGPQTRTDEVRVKEEAMSITDPQQRFDAVMKLIEARAKKQIERAQFYEKWFNEPDPKRGGAPRGTYGGADAAWAELEKRNPNIASINKNGRFKVIDKDDYKDLWLANNPGADLKDPATDKAFQDAWYNFALKRKGTK